MSIEANLESRINNLELSETTKHQQQSGGDELHHNQHDNIQQESEKWGLPLKELYRLSLCFYKEKSGKAVHLSYEDNLKLVAFTQQVIHGPVNPNTAQPVGVLDVIGKDRRLAWLQLGNISREQAMEGFVTLLDRLCPLFKPYIEAIKKDREEKERLAKVEEKRQKELQEQEKIKLEEQQKYENEKNREEQQRRQLQDALNSQTFFQFKAYAEKQYPGNPEQQAVLIRQLQTEHYHQYMQQLQAQYSTNPESDEHHKTVETVLSDIAHENSNQCESDNDSGEYSTIMPANMWTRPDIKQFKIEVAAGKGDGVIKVGHGDVVTVRVPTHEGGSCLFWEFATDSYDIGFGVYFEWGKPTTNEVSVHISESDDEDDALDDDDNGSNDLESGSTQQSSPALLKHRPPMSIIVPVYRRECQNEVYAGSHNYPGEGVYLLKFDNSYSLWRSKTLYYKVFYTR